MGSFTMALHRRLAKIMLALAGALLTVGPIAATAQEHGTAPPNGGMCRTAGAPFGGALNTPHWNGWAVDPSQRQYPRRGWRSLLRMTCRTSS
jgi:hypothetical protein